MDYWRNFRIGVDCSGMVPVKKIKSGSWLIVPGEKYLEMNKEEIQWIKGTYD